MDLNPDFGQTHFYEVRAYDDYGESDAESDYGHTTILAPVSVNASDTYEDRIELTWIDQSAIEDGYNIYRSGNPVGTLASNTTSFIDSTGDPARVGTYEELNEAYKVEIAGDYAYVAGLGAGLQIIDISNPAAPAFVGAYDTPGDRFRRRRRGRLRLRGGYSMALEVIDISNPATPVRVGHYQVPGGYGEAADVAVAGDYAYVADGQGTYPGLWIVDVSNPAAPAEAGRITYMMSRAYGVAVAGDYAYVADARGLSIVNISNPATPVLVGDYDTPASARDVAVSGDYAFVAARTSGLQIVHIGDPENPWLAGSYDTPGDAYDVAVAGDYAYVADADAGLQIVNISNPPTPGLAATFDTPGTAVGVAVAGGYVYVADYDSGLAVISRPAVDRSVPYDYCVRAYKGVAESESECDAGLVYAADSEARMTEVFSKVFASDGQAADYFGGSVSIDGDRAIIGADGTDVGAYENQGAAYIFERDAGVWTQKQKLVPTVGVANHNFGQSVSISGDHAIIGANGPGWSIPGSAYFFERVNGVWVQKQKVTAPAAQANDNFGWSVSIDRNYAVVGAIYHDVGDNEGQGLAFVYELVGTTWTYKSTLTATLGQEGDYFGWSVSISGGRAIVGALYHQVGANAEQGSAYIFERDAGGAWAQKQQLTASDGSAYDEFGSSVSISGDRAVVGAYMHDIGGNGNQGSAYVFERVGGGWTATETQRLTASDGAGGDRFGRSVSISGDRAVVGTANDVVAGLRTGSAYVFELEAEEGWKQVQKLVASDRTTDASFGESASISGDRSIVGAYYSNGGSAYLTDLTSAPGNVVASDGSVNNAVRVTWEDRSLNEKGYSIYRDGDRIDTVNPNVQGYDDFSAEPGRTYEYGVAALANDVSNETDRVTDLGWRPANGNITGRITTIAGAATDSIWVAVTPQQTKALLFDGNGGYVSVPDENGTFNFEGAPGYTIETWFKYMGDGGSGEYPVLIAKLAVVPGRVGPVKYPFILNNNRASGAPGQLAFGVTGVGGAASVETVRDDLNDNEWHHVACVRDALADSILIYVDGAFEGGATASGLGDVSNPEPLSIGAGYAEHLWFGGQLDEVRIWNVARSEADIKATMSKPLDGDEEGLVAYWPLNGYHGEDEEGIPVITDITSGAHYGTFTGGVYWTDDCVSLDIHPVTDQQGNYVVRNLYYGTDTTFDIKPFAGNHQFDPVYSRVSLTTDSPVENQVNFIDVSSFTVSGTIRYAGTGCPVAEVPVIVDGQTAGSTDKKGKFAVSVELGEHSIWPELEGHTFGPDSLTRFVERDMSVNDSTGVAFADSTTRTLSGRLGGGCGRHVGDVTLTVRSENDCLLWESTYLSGDSLYSVELPPQSYLVSASVDVQSIPAGLIKSDVVSYFQDLGARLAVMDSSDVTMDFVYRAPLKVVIAGLGIYKDEECSGLTFDDRTLPNVPVIPQMTVVTCSVLVYEDYGDCDTCKCDLDSGTVVIYDEIFDRQNKPFELEVRDGVAVCTTYTSTPSLVVGRVDEYGNDRSFQKAFRAVVDIEGRPAVTGTRWVLVTGHVAPEGADFITGTTKMPHYILRDPPGDGSYAYLEEGRTVRTTIRWEKTANFWGGGPELEVWNGVRESGFSGSAPERSTVSREGLNTKPI